MIGPGLRGMTTNFPMEPDELWMIPDSVWEEAAELLDKKESHGENNTECTFTRCHDGGAKNET